MSDVIRFKGHSYILATSPRVGARTLTLKEGDTFAVFDRFGDTGSVGSLEQGVYHKGTRVLSLHEFRLGTQRPLLLSSTVHERNAFMAVDLTNPDIPLGGEQILARGSIHVFRSMYLSGGALYCRTKVQNYADIPLDTDIEYAFDADFVDVFEVRGMRRANRGERTSQIEGRVATLLYHGLDGLTRRARLEFSMDPRELADNHARFSFRLPPRDFLDLFHTVQFEDEVIEPPSLKTFSRQRETLVARLGTPEACEVTTDNQQFDHWLVRSSADLRMLTTYTSHGPYPYAGVPWFSTIFGRDGIITALQYLWVDPNLARGVLDTLAATQAHDLDPQNDAEPGKILHEARDGEMPALGEVPYARYYGSADSTPLFVMLAGGWFRRTGDLAAAEKLWPNVERALDWIDKYGDLDGDGFIEYRRRRPDGLINQGWKDSDDSVMHADGRLAEPPIALCEVQAYVYAAKLEAAALAKALGREERGNQLAQQAREFRTRFEEAFWLDDMGTYALALDGQKRPCKVQSSNVGHVLYCGAARHDRARRVAENLLSPPMFSGWGVRTLSEDERRYNPMSYHNGSIWPHDNAMVAAGLARYGFADKVARILGGIFDAAMFVDLNRLPELFCGFPRQPGQGPTLYPVACIPQAWATGAAFMLLQACLGLEIEANPAEIRFNRPSLPPFLPAVRLTNLRVGNAVVDLLLTRYERSVGINVLRRDGEVAIKTVS